MTLEQCFSNHIYQADNLLFRQVVGGGIGARVTGVVARVLMDVWADLLSSKLEKNGITIYLLAKYVDDVNLANSCIPRGHSWQEIDGELRLTWTREREELDEQIGVSDSQRTMDLMKDIGDTLVHGLKLTADLPEYHPNGKCLMLDIQIWVEEKEGFHTIRHTF